MVGDDGGANQIGMAPGAQWIACDACNASTGCPGAALLTCAQWIAAPYPIGDPGSPDPDQRPHVVNNSWGDCGPATTIGTRAQSTLARSRHLSHVFQRQRIQLRLSRTPGCNTVGNPARYGNVTGVGSTGQSNGLYATHSNWGPPTTRTPSIPTVIRILSPRWWRLGSISAPASTAATPTMPVWTAPRCRRRT